MTKVLNRPENLTLDFYLDEDEDDLLPMPLLEDHEEKVNSVPEEKIAERVKLNPRKEKKTGTEIKIFTLNKLLTWFPVLLAQLKGGNNSYKVKNEIRQILYLLYQHNKIIQNLCNNLIKSS